MRSSLFLAMALAFGTGAATIDVADAQTARAARERAEASMTLSGVIEIGREGQVEAFTLDHRDKVQPEIASMVDRTVQNWRFEPVLRDGQPVAARTLTQLRLVAEQIGDGNMQVRVVDASFSDTHDQKVLDKRTDDVTRRSLKPPKYPKQAYSVNGQGVVLLLVKVGRDGSTTDVVAERVNLTVAGNDRAMEKMRDMLARSAITAARKWTFNPPTTGKWKDADHWTVRVPVHFSTRNRDERYGRWEAYIPGPRQAAPWQQERDVDVASTDLLPEGDISMVGGKPKGPRLLTPLG